MKHVLTTLNHQDIYKDGSKFKLVSRVYPVRTLTIDAVADAWIYTFYHSGDRWFEVHANNKIKPLNRHQVTDAREHFDMHTRNKHLIIAYLNTL
jgi:hypothetical protein